MTNKKPSTEERLEKNKLGKNKTDKKTAPKKPDMPEEFGGTNGPEPTRYGDWEHGGRCTDF